MAKSPTYYTDAAKTRPAYFHPVEEKKPVVAPIVVNANKAFNPAVLPTPVVPKPAAPVAPPSNAPILLNKTGEELFNAELQKTADVGTKYGLDGNFPTTIQGQIELSKARQKEQQDALTKSQQFQIADEFSAKQQYETQTKAAAADVRASMAQGREGPTSAGAPLVVSGYEAGLKAQTADLNRRMEANQFARDQAQLQLAQAQKDNNTKLAQSIQNNLTNLEQEQQQLNTRALDAASAASAEARQVEAAKAKNLDLFMSWNESGQNLSPAMIQGFAGSTGLNSDALLSTYALNQAVRDDKTLSLVEKQQKIADNNINLQRKIRGLDSKEAQAVAHLQQLRRQGASEADIRAFKQVAGITDEKDPIYQAELAVKQAEAKIKQNEAAGILVNPLDKAELAKRQQELIQANGGGVTYVPNSSKYTVAQSGDGIAVSVANGAVGGECGRFVNDVFGSPSFIGDSYDQKKSLITGQIPTAGMAFVAPAYGKYAGNGHVGIVESVNADGSFNVVDSNRDGPNKIGRKTMTVNEVDGFIKPPNAAAVGGGNQQESILLQVPKELRSSVTQKANQFDAEQQVKNFQITQEGWNFAQSIPSDTTNPADDQGLIYSFAKIMDPNSVVREGEYATVQKYAQTWLQNFGFNAARVVDNKEFLTKEARDNMKKTMKLKYDASVKSYDNARNSYINIIDNIAGKPVGSKLLQDYKVNNNTQETDQNDPLGVMPRPKTDPLKLF